MKSTALATALTALLLQGCLSPDTIKSVATQNEQNLANYSSNVGALAGALLKEVRFHAQLEVHRVRENVAERLIAMFNKLGGAVSDPDDALLSDQTKSWFTSTKTEVQSIKDRLATLSGDEEAAALLRADNPLLVDVAMDRPTFTIARIFRDSVTLDLLNRQFLNEKNPSLRRLIRARRDSVLDAYDVVRDTIDLHQTYEQALVKFLGVVLDQGKIAKSHAQAFVAYAQSQPELKTLGDALGDEELRNGALGLLEKKKGKGYADRVRGSLEKADDIFRIVDGLKGK